MENTLKNTKKSQVESKPTKSGEQSLQGGSAMSANGQSSHNNSVKTVARFARRENAEMWANQYAHKEGVVLNV